ncbi:hypothetical protein BDD12DRAFT_947735 [Trichophaea hybrida]|nr:hypothetical protein BDD12DRAFT_947735 [Trichophaea hybrida]
MSLENISDIVNYMATILSDHEELSKSLRQAYDILDELVVNRRLENLLRLYCKDLRVFCIQSLESTPGTSKNNHELGKISQDPFQIMKDVAKLLGMNAREVASTVASRMKPRGSLPEQELTEEKLKHSMSAWLSQPEHKLTEEKVESYIGAQRGAQRVDILPDPNESVDDANFEPDVFMENYGSDNDEQNHSVSLGDVLITGIKESLVSAPAFGKLLVVVEFLSLPDKDEWKAKANDKELGFQDGGVSHLENFREQHGLQFDDSQPQLTISDQIKVIIEKYIARTLRTQNLCSTAAQTARGLTQSSTGGSTTSQNVNDLLNPSQGCTPTQLPGVNSNTLHPVFNQHNSTAENIAMAYVTQAGLNTGNCNEKYLHWCVDSASTDTKLHHVCVESAMAATIGGNDFIEELNTSYKRLRGLRWTFSFTICIKAKIVKFIRLICDDDDLIRCLNDRLTISDLSTELDYHYKPLKPDNLHIERVEATLAHQLHCGLHCKPASIEQLISHLPKKVTGKLERNTTYGYGLHALQGLAFYKILIAHAVTQVPLWGFAAYWLIKHPGDLQNALLPALYMLALVTAVIGVADYYVK